MIEHVRDYHTADMDPWDFEFRGKQTEQEKSRQFKQARTGYTTDKAHSHFFVDDIDHPYNEIKRFDWMRGYHVGGRSLTWGRQTYRLSDLDFEANAKDGYGVDWPIRYKDIAPWYDYVEKYIGVSGQREGLAHLPDGIFLKPMELNCVEKHLKSSIAKNYTDRILTIGRVAHITEGTKPGAGRANCQYRNRCMRGCPYGAYFSSQASTLPAAMMTGNMTLRPNAIVHEVMYDDTRKRATGVRVIDAETNETYEYRAKIIFLCASTVASTSILMQSKSDRFPNGMGNDSGELGHNIMDHTWGAGASGKVEGYLDQYYVGRRPNGFYIPRFRNIDKHSTTKDFLRGYGYQGGASRSNWADAVKELKYGAALTNAIVEPGGWTIGMSGFGEILPYHENKLFLDYNKLDKWGLPTVTFDAEYKENERKIIGDLKSQAVEMLENAGFKEVNTFELNAAIGLGIHEMGTARMGRDPKTSVLNGFNQIHTVKNVFVTDGSCMTSSGTQNPSITYMALTARAAAYAIDQLNKQNL
jgi:choline dehydrogenase-like flavoprotein